MECWTPEADEAQLLRWWEPLLLAARRAREARVAWPIHIDEFTLAGRTDRRGRPSVWLYRHRASGRFLMADDTGQTYAFVPYRSGPSRGRFTEVDPSQAVWQAGLPEVNERVWYEYPDEPAFDAGGGDRAAAEGHGVGGDDAWLNAYPEAESSPGPPHPGRPARPRRNRSGAARSRGHLRLVSGGDGS